MNKPLYLGLWMLEISKALMYEFWYDYIKSKYQDNPKICYMDTDSFIPQIKTEYVYKGIANDVEKRFNTSNYAIKSAYWKKTKKVIGLMKDKFGGKMMTEVVALRPKIKKLKEQKMCNKTNTPV